MKFKLRSIANPSIHALTGALRMSDILFLVISNIYHISALILSARRRFAAMPDVSRAGRSLLAKPGRIAPTVVFISIATPLFATDLPNFYRVPFFESLPKTNLTDAATFIGTRIATGETEHSYDNHEHVVQLFNNHGPFELGNLALNLDNLTAQSKPLTFQFLGPTGSFSTLTQGNTIGQFTFDGSFSTNEIDLTLHQNLWNGFYFLAYIPFKHLHIRDISFVHTGATPASPQDQNTLNQFVANLDGILAENGLKPVATPFERTTIGDTLYAIGWQGYDNTSFEYLITSLQGAMQLGITAPTGKRAPRDQVFALPMGYDKCWGVNAHLAIQANGFSYFAFGAYGDITILWTETHPQRMKTDVSQNGWIILGEGRASTELGSVWNVGIYNKADHFFGGLSALIGYSFAKQEKSRLHVHDKNFLHDYIEQSLQDSPPVIVSPSKIASSDKRLKGWHQHTMHFLVEYDFGTHFKGVFAPVIDFIYDVAIIGKNTWVADMIGGELGLQFTWIG